VLLEKVDALNRIAVHDLSSGASFRIDFPEAVYCLYISSIQSSYYFNANIIRFSYSSPTTPKTVYDYTIPTQHRDIVQVITTETPHATIGAHASQVQEIPSGHNPADYRVTRLDAPAADGQLVPVFVLHHANTTPSPSSPLYVYVKLRFLSGEL
jgi:oligopeptidase B